MKGFECEPLNYRYIFPQTLGVSIHIFNFLSFSKFDILYPISRQTPTLSLRIAVKEASRSRVRVIDSSAVEGPQRYVNSLAISAVERGPGEGASVSGSPGSRGRAIAANPCTADQEFPEKLRMHMHADAAYTGNAGRRRIGK